VAEDHGNEQHGGEGGEHKAHKSHGAHGPGHGGGHEEHAGAPEWLISFADNVALLMGFFVILLAMNMGPKNKASGASGDGPGGHKSEPSDFSEAEANVIEFKFNMMDGFNNRPSLHSKDPATRKLAKDYEKVQDQKKRKGVDGTDTKPKADDASSEINPNLTVEFDQGSYQLSISYKGRIASLVRNELIGKNWIIEARGHVSASEARDAERAARAATDASTDEGAASMFPAAPDGGTGAGFLLSYQRAHAVAVEMARNGIPWRNIRIVACSDMDRVASRAEVDPNAPRRNQRVLIIQTKVQVPADPNSVDPGAAKR